MDDVEGCCLRTLEHVDKLRFLLSRPRPNVPRICALIAAHKDWGVAVDTDLLRRLILVLAPPAEYDERAIPRLDALRKITPALFCQAPTLLATGVVQWVYFNRLLLLQFIIDALPDEPTRESAAILKALFETVLRIYYHYTSETLLKFDRHMRIPEVSDAFWRMLARCRVSFVNAPNVVLSDGFPSWLIEQLTPDRLTSLLFVSPSHWDSAPLLDAILASRGRDRARELFLICLPDLPLQDQGIFRTFLETHAPQDLALWEGLLQNKRA